MGNKRPDGPPPPPVVQRLRVRYAKRGRLRFTSHRDVDRMLQRALRRAGVPMAFSAGFSPHPKISYVGAAPTGVATEAEYLELGLAVERDPAEIRKVLDEALPPGIDVVDVVAVVPGETALPDRIDASRWRLVVPGVTPGEAATAVAAFLEREAVLVARRTGDGTREVDARGAVVELKVCDEPCGASPCATLLLVVRHTTPAVRPDDVLTAVRQVTGLAPAAPLQATRLAQGLLDGDGEVADPFAAV